MTSYNLFIIYFISMLCLLIIGSALEHPSEDTELQWGLRQERLISDYKNISVNVSGMVAFLSESNDKSNQPNGNSMINSTTLAPNESEQESISMTLPKLIENVMPGIVLIYCYDKDGNWISQGSGFFINQDGDVITCYHVVNDTSIDHISVYPYSSLGSTYNVEGLLNLPPQVIIPSEQGYPVKEIAEFSVDYDLARLSVMIPPNLDIYKGKVTALKINYSYPYLGEDLTIFGSPQGNYFSVSRGIISAIRWPWEVSGETPEAFNISEAELIKSYIDKPIYIQTDAAMSEGSSGGPATNDEGEVIGIADMVMKEGQNLNYLIPARYIEKVTFNASSFSLIKKKKSMEGVMFERWDLYIVPEIISQFAQK